MLLCDIGNSSYHFLDAEKDYKESVENFAPHSLTQKVYFISVNAHITKLLEPLDNWIDISVYIEKNAYYETMGIDRIVALQTLRNAIVIDAGSAITVDVINNGVFMGGFIYPGLHAMSQTYKNISPALDYSFNFGCKLDIMPKNSQDAISYGYLKGLYLEVLSHKLPIILTGGDAKYLKRVFKDAVVDEELLFAGMKKIIKKANLC